MSSGSLATSNLDNINGHIENKSSDPKLDAESQLQEIIINSKNKFK